MARASSSGVSISGSQRPDFLRGLGALKIDGEGGCGAAGLADRVGDAIEALGIAGEQQHVGARATIALGHRLADTARGACDEY
jgi:hypothetical protein